MIRTFDDLVKQVLTTGKPHRMLFVCPKADTMDEKTKKELFEGKAEGKAGFVKVVRDFSATVAHDLAIEKIVEFADAHAPEWNFPALRPG